MAATDVLKDIVIAGVEGLFDDGLIYNLGKEDDGKGGFTRDPADPVPCKIKVDTVTEEMQAEVGYTDKDVALYVLQNGVSLSSHNEVSDQTGQRYSLGILKTDPVNSHWLVRGTPING